MAPAHPYDLFKSYFPLFAGYGWASLHGSWPISRRDHTAFEARKQRESEACDEIKFLNSPWQRVSGEAFVCHF